MQETVAYSMQERRAKLRHLAEETLPMEKVATLPWARRWRTILQGVPDANNSTESSNSRFSCVKWLHEVIDRSSWRFIG